MANDSLEKRRLRQIKEEPPPAARPDDIGIRLPACRVDTRQAVPRQPFRATKANYAAARGILSSGVTILRKLTSETG